MQSLHLYSLQEAIDYLAPTLRVNGRIIKALRVSRIRPLAPPSTETVLQDSGGQETVVAYQRISIDNLGHYIGRQVRLTTDQDYVFAGKLVSVGERIATIAVANYGRTDNEIVLLSHVAKTELEITPAKGQ